MIFGSVNDVGTLLHIGRELVGDVVEQEVLYYKICLEDTQENMYGEASLKYYWTPLHLNCLIRRGDQDWKDEDYGSDLYRSTDFAFFKEDLRDRNLLLEVGDIIEWSKSYFEIDGVKENQMFLGKDLDYRMKDPTWKFGSSVSVVAKTHLTRLSKLNIKDSARDDRPRTHLPESSGTYL